MNGQCINRFEIVLILRFCFMIMTGTIFIASSTFYLPPFHILGVDYVDTDH